MHKPQGFSFLGTPIISGISVILVLQLAPQALIPALPAVHFLLYKNNWDNTPHEKFLYKGGLRMGKLNPYNLQMQITKMFEQGQSFFATTKVQDWLKERNKNPADYDIIFHKKPAPPGSKEVMVVEIELKRKDGQPVDAWLQEQANLQG